MNESDARSASFCARARTHTHSQTHTRTPGIPSCRPDTRSSQALAQNNIISGDKTELSAVEAGFHMCEWSNMLLVIDTGIRPSLPPPPPALRCLLPQSWKRLSISRLINAAARPVWPPWSPPAGVDRLDKQMCACERWWVIMVVEPWIQKP